MCYWVRPVLQMSLLVIVVVGGVFLLLLNVFFKKLFYAF